VFDHNPLDIRSRVRKATLSRGREVSTSVPGDAGALRHEKFTSDLARIHRPTLGSTSQLAVVWHGVAASVLPLDAIEAPCELQKVIALLGAIPRKV
jgi:hypothetical protein